MPRKATGKRKYLDLSSDEEIDPEGFFADVKPTKATTAKKASKRRRPIKAPEMEAPEGVKVMEASELGHVAKRSFNYRNIPSHDAIAPGSVDIPEGAPDCLRGLTFVISGNFVGMSRPQAEDLIKTYGGRVTGSVSGKTSYLVIGMDYGATKAEKARKLGTKVLTEDSFLDLIRLSGSGDSSSSQNQKGKKTGSAANEGSPHTAGDAHDDGPQSSPKKRKNKETKTAKEKNESSVPAQPEPTDDDDDDDNYDNDGMHIDSSSQDDLPTTPPKKRTRKIKEKKTAPEPETKQPDEIEPGKPRVFGFPAKELPNIKPKAWSFASKANGTASSHSGYTAPTGAANCLEGLTFVVTGEMEACSREQMEDTIKSYGGRVTKKVSGRTDYLVVGEDPGSSKVKDAKSHNIMALREKDLFELITSSGPANSNAEVEGAMEDSAQDRPRLPKTKETKQAGKQADSIAPSETPTAATTANSRSGKNAESADTELWTEKYKPRALKDLCGHKAQAEELMKWLEVWAHGGIPDPGAVLISGPPGIGKTTTAHLVAKLMGFDVLELNASEARSKSTLERILGQTVENRSIKEFARSNKSTADGESEAQNKLVIIMDEVDGMSGGDRGGTTKLIGLVKTTKVPIICICNDRHSTKVRALAGYCKDMRFRRPSEAQMRARLNTIAFRENFKIDQNAITQLVQSTGNDIRQIINLMSSYALTKDAMSYTDSKSYSTLNQKEVAVGPFDIIGKYLNGHEFSSASFADKLGYYYNDFGIIPLFVQENYIDNNPARAGVGSASEKEHALNTLECLSKASDYIAQADVIDSRMRGSQQWGLMPLHSAMSCVGPSFYMNGRHNGMYRFPGWLGQNSKGMKHSRMLGAIQSHMRLRIATDKTEIRTSYVPAMAPALISPLVDQGAGGIAEVVEIMDHYYLNKDDWDAVFELHLDGARMLKQVPTAVKSAFTREYNKGAHPIAFQGDAGGSVSRRAGGGRAQEERPDLEDLVDDDGDDDGAVDGDGGEESSEESDDIANDKLIKKASNGKAKAKGSGKSKAGGKAKSKRGGKAARK